MLDGSDVPAELFQHVPEDDKWLCQLCSSYRPPQVSDDCDAMHWHSAKHIEKLRYRMAQMHKNPNTIVFNSNHPSFGFCPYAQADREEKVAAYNAIVPRAAPDARMNGWDANFDRHGRDIHQDADMAPRQDADEEEEEEDDSASVEDGHDRRAEPPPPGPPMAQILETIERLSIVSVRVEGKVDDLTNAVQNLAFAVHNRLDPIGNHNEAAAAKLEQISATISRIEETVKNLEPNQ